MSKYKAQPTTVGGIRFASKAEARRYAELRLLEQAGAISELTLQPAYELQPAFTDATGTRHRAIRYVGDFQYRERGRLVVEDVKGMETATFKLKAKLFLFWYSQLDFRIIKA